MWFKFTPHCQYRILERVLNVEHIKQAILKSDKKRDAGDGFRDRKNHYFVITAYYL